MAAVAVMLAVMDAITTYIGITFLGGVELAPVAAYFFNTIGMVPWIVTSLAIEIILIYWLFSSGGDRDATKFLRLGYFSARLFIVVWNCINIGIVVLIHH